MSPREKLVARPLGTKEAFAMRRVIDDVQDSLDRLLVMYEQGGDMDNALADLLAWTGDLENAIENIKPRLSAKGAGQ